MSDQAELMDQMPVEIYTKPHIRSDGNFVRVTLKQGDAEIKLTPEQVKSLCVALKVYVPD